VRDALLDQFFHLQEPPDFLYTAGVYLLFCPIRNFPVEFIGRDMRYVGVGCLEYVINNMKDIKLTFILCYPPL
jgi:hypothetical protein